MFANYSISIKLPDVKLNDVHPLPNKIWQNYLILTSLKASNTNLRCTKQTDKLLPVHFESITI